MKNKDTITLAQFAKEVTENYKMAIGKLPTADLKKLYNKRLSVDDSVSYLIMKS